MMYINPDDELGSPRNWTPERNKAAWEQCFLRLRVVLQSLPQPADVYVVCGVQGAGKTRWVIQNGERFSPACVVFDAALPGACHRAPILAIAAQYRAVVTAVWINVPLDCAKRQNRHWPVDEVVPDDVVEAVYERFEPPQKTEGFHRVVEISQGGESPGNR
jgi:hypothetical protein